MKMILAFLAVSLSFVATGYSQKPKATPTDFRSVVQKEVESTIRSYMAGFSAAKCDDVTPVSRFVRDNTIHVASDDIYTVSLAEYEDGLRELVCGWVSHSGTVDSIIVDPLSKDIAVAAWLYHDEYKLKSGKLEKVKGSVLMTLVRSPNGWKIAATKQENVVN